MHTRYALYYTAAGGAWWDWATAWLGWDAAAARPASHPDAGDLDVADITARPRKYGLHATLKPPFRLADGHTVAELEDAAAAFAARTSAAVAEGLQVSTLGRFLALTPVGQPDAINACAASVVEAFEPFRAPLTQADLDRRRAGRLSAEQDALLLRWGYPYVMDQFRFHITLSGPLPAPVRASVQAVLSDRLEPLLPTPFRLDGLALSGERPDGKFEVLHRYTFAG